MTVTEPAVELSGHPLHPVREEEVHAVRRILADAGLLPETVRCCFFGPEEPEKSAVLAGDTADRRFRVLLLDLPTGASRDVVVSVTRSTVDAVAELDPRRDGQLPIIDTEFELIEEILAGHEEWRAALTGRGLDPDQVRVVPLSAGSYFPQEAGRRVVRTLGFWQEHEKDHPWAHPVDGLVAYVDLTTHEVMEVLDHRSHPVPREPGNFDDPAQAGPARTTLKPIEITQPDGVSFTVEDGLLRWENFELRIGFNEREGLTLHQISFDGRPIVYRASIAEMVVPYADPSPVRFWQNYFDCGEYMFARYANSLELGCDCLGEIKYLDAVIADDQLQPQVIRNAICLHEEDYGVLWKHSDLFAGSQETRRQRRMVVSFFTTIGNYDYGFYWYLYLDGTIECEAKATGVVFTSAYPEDGHPYASEVAPGLGAPYHQHLFSARLDMMVDGPRNAVDEVEAAAVPVGPGNPHGNAFTERRTRLHTESEAQRNADQGRARVWQIVNPERQNRLGRNVAYALYPQGQPTLLADETSVVHARANFATRHLWVTPYADAERYPAGDFVNQHPGGGGLPAWTAADRNVDGEDIVLWHTFGLTHFPRPEDWPVMPVDYAGFTLKPVGFFDRNPTLDVPPSTSSHCCHDE